MSGDQNLQVLLRRSAQEHPDRIAVVDPSGAEVSYRELDRLSDRLRDRLHHVGVRRGDRVGIYLRKSIDSIVSIFGILKAGAAYVPVDPDAPVGRCAYILDNCAVRAVLTEARLAGSLAGELRELGASPALLATDEDAAEIPLRSLLDREDATAPAAPVDTVYSDPDELAYILYTSGSTGRPKGVMLSHRAARTFIDWCTSVFDPTEVDVFSSHAPLHFDLSVHDVFVSLKHGSKLVLMGEQQGKDPLLLAELIAERKISIWYSTPSILNLLASYGKLERYDFSPLRIVLFAGEVFPIPQLRAIKEAWPHPRYFNLYGPTETNVCTYYEVPETIPAERTEPLPIGCICPPLRGRVVDEEGRDVSPGSEGELVVNGSGVMEGYWNLPERNALAFLVDEQGARWYRTGDVVVEDTEGNYIFHGRRDRMVKRRGYRIELGEIEAALASHPGVREAAVVATSDPTGVRINAALSLSEGERPSVISFKQFCAERLPRYMIPDTFTFVEALPRTSTDKIDYQTLAVTV